MPDLLHEQWVKDEYPLDFGHDHYGRFVGWDPDRDLNPQYADRERYPAVEKYGMEIMHFSPAGVPCAGFTTFAGEVQRLVEPARPNTWDVISWDPLTISPSVLCSCGDHGFVQGGRWVPA